MTFITQAVALVTVAPVMLTTLVPAVSVKVAPAQPASLPPLGVEIFKLLFGKVSEMATPVRLSVFGLVMVMVSESTCR